MIVVMSVLLISIDKSTSEDLNLAILSILLMIPVIIVLMVSIVVYFKCYNCYKKYSGGYSIKYKDKNLPSKNA